MGFFFGGSMGKDGITKEEFMGAVEAAIGGSVALERLLLDIFGAEGGTCR